MVCWQDSILLTNHVFCVFGVGGAIKAPPSHGRKTLSSLRSLGAVQAIYQILEATASAVYGALDAHSQGLLSVIGLEYVK